MADIQPRFGAIVGTRDEPDILPRMIDHLRRIGVERIIIVDRGSQPASLEVAAAAEADGDLLLVRTDWPDDADLVRAAKVSLAHGLGTEWVMFVDSDELPLPLTGSLHDLSDLDHADVISVLRYNVVLTEDGLMLPEELDQSTYDRVELYAQPISNPYRVMIEDPDMPWIRGVLEPKMLLRTEAVQKLHKGDHNADISDARPWRRALATDLIIAHAPFRSLDAFEARSANVRQNVLDDPERFKNGNAWQWSRFARILDEGHSREEFDRQVLDSDGLEALRAENVVRSAAQMFERLIPAVESEEQYDAMAMRAQPWISAAGLVCRREGIEPQGILKHVSKLWYPTVLAPPDHIIKFYGDRHEGDVTLERELLAFRALRQDPSLPVPRLVGHGELNDEYRYLVTSVVPGHAINTVAEHVSPANRRSLAGWLGDFVRQIQAIEVADEDVETAWSRFHFITTWRHEHAVEIARDLGFPDRFAKALPEWLPPTEELLVRSEASVFCHGDLTDANIIGWPNPPNFEPSGVIDFNQSFLGHPIADLGPLWWDPFARDRLALATFLSKAELPGSGEPEFARMALTWSLLNPVWKTHDLSDIADVADLDDLAERWFGDLPGSASAGVRAAGESETG